MTSETDNDPDSDDTPNIEAPDEWTQVAQRHYDPRTPGELTTAIVFAIADARGGDPGEVRSPPLYDIVDVAAIEDVFFTDSATDDGDGTGTTEFRYEEFLVRVQSDGWVRVNTDSQTATEL